MPILNKVGILLRIYAEGSHDCGFFSRVHSSVTNCSRSVRKESHRFEGNGSMDNASIDAKISRTPTQTFSPAVVAPAFHHNTNVCAVKHHFSSPIVSWIEDIPLVGHVSHVTDPELRNEHLEPSCSDSSTSNAVHDMHISGRLMEEFMELAKDNTSKNLETCGILGASFKNQTFYVTTLIVPKQESTAHSCQALNEEEIHAILDKQSLFPAGWIHTHPSQTCFLSSIDLHTQYSYQVMLPEAIAIVMAPTDTTRSFGIFRVTDPGGIQVLRECKESGFHSHKETADGSPLFEHSSNIYINPNLRFEIIDLRTS